MSQGLFASWPDVWLFDGARTPFVDYNGALALVSPTDLGIKVAREAIARSGITPEAIGSVVAGSVAQASFDAYMLPRHIGLYAGLPQATPAHLVQRVCGTGIEALMQGADAITHRGLDAALCVGSESMSRNPNVAPNFPPKVVPRIWSKRSTTKFLILDLEGLSLRNSIYELDISRYAVRRHLALAVLK